LNEQDFRTALRDTMSVQVAPPQMSDAPVLEAAHRDRKRRRAKWAGLGSAAAVVAVAAGVAFLAPSGPGDGGVHVGAQPPSGSAPASDTKTSWPKGQTDRTATSGTQYERGATLADKLAEVVPAGYDLPDSLPGSDLPAKDHQAQFADRVGDKDVWEYMAYASPTKGAGAGELLVLVNSPGGATGDGCGIEPALWGMTGNCTAVAVDGKQVAVVDITTDNRFDQWAGYRYEDGTTVFVAQGLSHHASGQPALGALPFTSEQLAALAVDPRFKVV
jgi:hypothetical protein